MKRIIQSLALAAGLAASGLAHAQDLADRPNIVMIILDDVGLTDLGVTGGEAATPAMDALARRGLVFANFNTAPMCAPSRAMMLTGVVSHDAGGGESARNNAGGPARRARL